jgi:hypothetical protein
VQNSYDLDLILAHYLKENYMATLGKFEITGSDKVTRFSYLRIIGKTMKRIIKFLNVDVSLGFAPALFCKFRNRAQIAFCRTG